MVSPWFTVEFLIFVPMETNRQKRITRLLQKDLGEIFQVEGRGWFPGTLVTVTKVQITNDLSIAKVYLSIFGKNQSGVIGQVSARGKEIRGLLGIRIKNQLRIVPELRFFVDDSLDYLENIERLLKQ